MNVLSFEAYVSFYPGIKASFYCLRVALEGSFAPAEIASRIGDFY
jgi:hypothetical protein